MLIAGMLSAGLAYFTYLPTERDNKIRDIWYDNSAELRFLRSNAPTGEQTTQKQFVSSTISG